MGDAAARDAADAEYLRAKGVGRVIDSMVRALIAKEARPARPLQFMLEFLKGVQAEEDAAPPSAKPPARRRSGRRTSHVSPETSRDVLTSPLTEAGAAKKGPRVRDAGVPSVAPIEDPQHQAPPRAELTKEKPLSPLSDLNPNADTRRASGKGFKAETDAAAAAVPVAEAPPPRRQRCAEEPPQEHPEPQPKTLTFNDSFDAAPLDAAAAALDTQAAAEQTEQAVQSPRFGSVAPPEVLWIASGGYPELDGPYEILGAFNGMPFWGRLAYRLYSTQGGRWMLTDQEDKMCDNKGAISATLLHGGVALPPEVGSWDEYLDGRWYQTDLTVSTSRHAAVRNQPSQIPNAAPGATAAPHPNGALLPQPVRVKAIQRFYDPPSGVAMGGAAMQGWAVARTHAASCHPTLLFSLADGPGAGAAHHLPMLLAPQQYRPLYECLPAEQVARSLAGLDTDTALAAVVVVPDPAGPRPEANGAPPRFIVQTIHTGDCHAVLYSTERQGVAFATRPCVRGAGPAVHLHSAAAGDTIILASPAVAAAVANDEAAAIVRGELRRSGQDAAAAAARVCDAALHNGAVGNLACSVVVLSAPNTPHVDTNLPLVECVPGPFAAAWHDGFRRGYEDSALDGGMTLAEALAKRYGTVQAQVAQLRGDEQDAAALRDEFARFHPYAHDAQKLERMRPDERVEWLALWVAHMAMEGA
eukprot:TRINITY_DN10583_c0_g2_i1.p1 TRINITY_DN10583_c0_g2~~TRINITY_DN10583_c0_g2_i1.p1  ORF type:complete len:698 (+),score=227.00 TRINITY_DN10583_c0_g2_i1:87-2180(+)